MIDPMMRSAHDAEWIQLTTWVIHARANHARTAIPITSALSSMSCSKFVFDDPILVKALEH
jgi:hypothetical protein